MCTLFRPLAKVLIICLLAKVSFASNPIPGVKRVAIRHDVTSIDNIVQYDKKHPAGKTDYIKDKQREENEGEIPDQLAIPNGAVIKKEALTNIGEPHIFSITPPPDISFNALTDNNSTTPPDVNGAVGLDYVMTTLNSQFRIQYKDGSPITSFNMSGFWNGLGSSGFFDPRIVYDPYNDRWITVAASNSWSASSALLVAVSETNDPTKSWYRYRIDATALDTMWLDFPSLGFNKDWIIVTGNMFGNISGTFCTSYVYVLDKVDFYSGGSGQYTEINGGFTAAAICPAITYDNSNSTEYLIQRWNPNSGGNGYIRLYTIAGAVGSETLTAGNFASTPNPWSAGLSSDFGPQYSTSNKLQCNDDRMMSCIYRNGSIWCTHTVYLPAVSPTRTAVQWWQLTPSAAITAKGRIDDATGTNFYSFPSLAVNSRNDAVIGCSVFSSSTYASACYALKLSTDAAFETEYIFKDGDAKYYKTYSGTRNRWGDYSMTQVDPSNDIDFWTLQQYALSPSGGYDRWGTWWAKMGLNSGLPIELLEFTAKALNDHSVICKWTTASELNNDYFTTERSRDGVFFEPIGIVKGAGNSTTMNHYFFTDERPYEGIGYYRLKETDFDQRYSYSDIAVVSSFKKAPIFDVYQNPQSGQASINFSLPSNNYVSLSVFGITGIYIQNIFEGTVKAGVYNQVNFNTTTLSDGLYYLRLISDQTSEIRIITIQK